MTFLATYSNFGINTIKIKAFYSLRCIDTNFRHSTPLSSKTHPTIIDMSDMSNELKIHVAFISLDNFRDSLSPKICVYERNKQQGCFFKLLMLLNFIEDPGKVELRDAMLPWYPIFRFFLEITWVPIEYCLKCSPSDKASIENIETFHSIRGDPLLILISRLPIAILLKRMSTSN